MAPSSKFQGARRIRDDEPKICQDTDEFHGKKLELMKIYKLDSVVDEPDLHPKKPIPKSIHQDLIVTKTMSDVTKIITCQIGCQQKSSRQN